MRPFHYKFAVYNWQGLRLGVEPSKVVLSFPPQILISMDRSIQSGVDSTFCRIFLWKIQGFWGKYAVVVHGVAGAVTQIIIFQQNNLHFFLKNLHFFRKNLHFCIYNAPEELQLAAWRQDSSVFSRRTFFFYLKNLHFSCWRIFFFCWRISFLYWNRPSDFRESACSGCTRGPAGSIKLTQISRKTVAKQCKSIENGRKTV